MGVTLHLARMTPTITPLLPTLARTHPNEGETKEKRKERGKGWAGMKGGNEQPLRIEFWPLVPNQARILLVRTRESQFYTAAVAYRIVTPMFQPKLECFWSESGGQHFISQPLRMEFWPLDPTKIRILLVRARGSKIHTAAVAYRIVTPCSNQN